MYPYPTALPIEEIRDLLPILRGQAPPVEHAAHCAWVVTGYGLSQILPCDHPDVYTAPVPMSDAEAADHLERCCAVQGAADAAAIPWDLLLPVLFEIVRRWLDSRK